MAKTFTCWKCKQTFPKEWSEEEAEAEYTSLFGQHMGEEREVLCDDCNNEFHAWFKKQDRKKFEQ